ncbi:hypothetical protein CEW92_08710 [Bacillaceae bacterium SAS-127]|nr:hypothetical protein CEW92_08710 [Bacillaceae bacterium SAS-127]
MAFFQIIKSELLKLINIMTLGLLVLFLLFTVIDYLIFMRDLEEYAIKYSEERFIVSINIGLSLLYLQIFLLYISSTILGKEKRLKTMNLLYGDYKSRMKINLSKVVTGVVICTLFSFISVLSGWIAFHFNHILIDWKDVVYSFVIIDSIYILYSLVVLSLSFLLMSFNFGQIASFFVNFFLIIILGQLITGSINAGELANGGVVAQYFVFYQLYNGFSYLHYSLSEYIQFLLMCLIILSYSLYRLEKIDIQ